MSVLSVAPSELVERAARIGAEIAAPAADAVDRDARFPVEAFDALRDERLLSALVPPELGGSGASVSDVARMTRALGAHCSSTALIFAMHHAQVACLVRHGLNDLLRDFLEELCDAQSLLGSATTEHGVGGDLRTSLCAVQRAGTRFSLEKRAPVISYGVYADAILATARRSPESAPGDQVLVLCRPPELTLEQVSEWDALGFRGTCGPGFTLRTEGDTGQIVPAPFSQIAATTMIPVAHVLWSSAWLGIATAAVDQARRCLRAAARREPGVTPPAAIRLAELSAAHQQMAELVAGHARRYEASRDNPASLTQTGFAIAMNNLKVSASTMVVDIVGRALEICGLDAYRLDTPYSMGRLLRDAYGAPVMVSNHRLLASNAQRLLAGKER